MSVILHVRIPGEPVTYERVGGFGKWSYDPTKEQKKTFRWLVKAAAPGLRPVMQPTPVCVSIQVWSTKKPVKKRLTGKLAFRTDWDNYAKFYCDALNGLAWEDDSQVIDGRVQVHRAAMNGVVEIVVWTD